MKLECRLKLILEANGLFRHGIYEHIAKETGVSRKIVRALCLNEKCTVSFDVVERICDWLLEKNLAVNLPADFFGRRSSSLVAALCRGGHVTIYLGEYRQDQSQHIPRSWVSRADAQVASSLVEMLTSSAARDSTTDDPFAGAGDSLQPLFVYVPSHFASIGSEESPASPPNDLTREARDIYGQYKLDTSGASGIFIGSQRANFLVELFVADLFDCPPFESAPGKLPFYLYKRTNRNATTESCFGGSDALPGWKGKAKRGLFYRDGNGAWACCPWNDSESDAGIVIVRRDPGRDQTDIAVFGYSGLATMALGDFLRRNPDAFWTDLEPFGRGIEARVFVCPITLTPGPRRVGSTSAVVVKSVDVKMLTLKPKKAKARRRS